MTGSPTLIPSSDLDLIAETTTGTHAFLYRAVASVTVRIFSMPAKVTMELLGTVTMRWPACDDDVGLGERAGTKVATVVGHFGFDHQSPVVLGDGRGESHDAPVICVGVALHGEVDGLAEFNEPGFAFRYREAQAAAGECAPR